MIRRAGLGFVAWVVLIFLLSPLLIVVYSTLTTVTEQVSYFALPPRGFTLHWLLTAFDDPNYRDALWLSTKLAVVVALLSTTVGAVAAFGLQRSRGRLASVIESLLMAPLVIPIIITAIGILQAVSLTGLGTSAVAIAVGHTVVAIPYSMRVIRAVLYSRDQSLVRAAQGLGASPPYVFWRVTVPAIRPGLLASLGFAFLVSFDDVTIAVFLAAPGMVTLPVRLFTQMSYPVTPTLLGVSTTLILGTAVVIILMERVFRISTLAGRRSAQR